MLKIVAIMFFFFPNCYGAESLPQISQHKVAEAGGSTVTLSGVPLRSKVIVSIGNEGEPPYDISSKVESILLRSGYRVIDRALIEQVLSEQKKSASGLLDRDQQLALGKISGADYLLAGLINTGRGSDFAQTKTSIQLKTINLQTAEIVGSDAWEELGYGEDGWDLRISKVLGGKVKQVKRGKLRQIVGNSKVLVVAYMTDRNDGVYYKTPVYGHPTHDDKCVNIKRNTLIDGSWKGSESPCRPRGYSQNNPAVSLFYSTYLENLLLAKGYKLIDRTFLERVLKEQRFSTSGLVDPKEQIEVGKLAGAEYLLVADGFCAYPPKKIRETWGIKLVNLSTTEIVAAGFVSSRGFCKTNSMSKKLKAVFKDAFLK